MPTKRVLYGHSMSPPVRAVQLTLAALDLDYELKPIDIYGERTQEYLKKNPQHTIPTLEEEDGKCLWDSHAIMAYLVRKYGKDDALYPKDFYERAVVDQRLHYENGVMFTGLKPKVLPLLKGEAKKEEIPIIMQSVFEIYEMLETFLKNNKFIAGKLLTIADFSILTSMQFLSMFVPINTEKFPKLAAWFENLQKLPYYEAVCGKTLKQLQEKFAAAVAAME